MQRKILVDADGLLYKAAVKGTTVIEWEQDEVSTLLNLDNAWREFMVYVKRISAQTQSTDLLFCLSDKSSNYYRKEVLPTYKAKRPPKPAIYPAVKQRLLSNFPTKTIARLEADDLLGILSDKNTVQVSFDKDIKQVAGKFYDLTHDIMLTISPEEADFWFYYQCLAGDSTDGYTGIPKVGDKKARKILDNNVCWEAVLQAYEAKGLSESDALVQARVARILRPDEYCFETNKIKLWKEGIE